MTLFGVSVGENVGICGGMIYGKYRIGDCPLSQTTPDNMTKPRISMKKFIHNTP